MLQTEAFSEHVHMINNQLLRNEIDAVFVVSLGNGDEIATSLTYDFDGAGANLYAAIGAVEALKQELLGLIGRDE